MTTVRFTRADGKILQYDDLHNRADAERFLNTVVDQLRPDVKYEIIEEKDRLKSAREVIEMLNAAVSQDEIEAAKSAAYEWLKCS